MLHTNPHQVCVCSTVLNLLFVALWKALSARHSNPKQLIPTHGDTDRVSPAATGTLGQIPIPGTLTDAKVRTYTESGRTWTDSVTKLHPRSPGTVPDRAVLRPSLAIKGQVRPPSKQAEAG